MEKVRLSSGNAIESPIDFEGGRFELGDPCRRTNAEPSLIIPHYRVRSVSDPSIIRDFVVGADAFLLPGGMELPEDLQNINKWSKVAGPDSGNFKNLKDLDNQYQNPKKGGVYELQFELLGSKTKALLHLPLAGPRAESWVENQKGKLANVAIIITGMCQVNATICYMATSATLDWRGAAHQSGHSPCRVFGKNETITIHGIVISDPTFQNFMWGFYCRIFYPTVGWWTQVLLAAPGFVGTPDTPEAWQAYRAGKEWHDGESLATVMERRGLKMQETSGKVDDIKEAVQ